MAEPLRLAGCTPEPLMGYLKALGVLRLLAEQMPDAAVRGWWANDTFLLQTSLDEAGVIRFFTERYKPTPLIAPWGGRSGFYPGSSETAARAAILALEQSSDERLAPFRQVICVARAGLTRLGLAAKAEDEDKVRLMQACRAELPDGLIDWLDAVFVLTNEGRSFPPLLGTGGNEGSGSYVSGFAQMVVQAVARRQWDHAVAPALFGHTCCASYSNQTPGHFSPGDLGGTNPWDFMLALEGSCLWASGLVRRAGQIAGEGVAAFPFSVKPIAAGGPALCGSDEKRPKDAKRDVAELWLPLWDRPSTASEIRALLAEGRAEINRVPVETGLDFALAVANLGVDRGVRAFQRVAFVMRNGKNFFASSLGKVPVNHRPDSFLIEEVRPWLNRFRQKCHEKETPARFGSAVRRIDAAIFEFCKYGGQDRLAAVLRALGNAERELAVGDLPSDKRAAGRRPLGGLSSDWIAACDDGSAEYRLARGVAFIAAPLDGKVPPVRAYLEVVERGKKGWTWAEQTRAAVWSGGSLARNLGAVLSRRLLDARRVNAKVLPLASPFPVSLADVSQFLAGRVDDLRVEELLWGFVLTESPAKGGVQPVLDDKPAEPLPRAYALLKLSMLPGRIGWVAAGERSFLRHFHRADSEEGVAVRPEPSILARLRAGDVLGACDVAVRRLRAAGFVPLPGPFADGSRRAVRDLEETGPTADRLAAALLFPITSDAVDTLGQMVLRRPSAELLT